MNLYVFGLILIVGLIFIQLIDNWFKKRKEEKQGWRVRRKGRGGISYEQKVEGKWEQIEVDGELLLGKINLVLYFETEIGWTKYPKWAQNRNEILSRIKSKFPPKTTDYEND